MATKFETIAEHRDDGTYAVSDWGFAMWLTRLQNPTKFPCPKCGGRLIEWNPAPYCIKCGHILDNKAKGY